MKLSEECANMDYRGRHSLIQKIKALEDELALSKDTIAELRADLNVIEDENQALKAYWKANNE